MKRRKLTVFSLSFIDCICCGLGAIILLFVVVNSQNTAQRQRVTEELNSETNRWELEVLAGRRDLVQARNALDEITAELAKTEGLSRKILQAVSEKRLELADRDKQTLASREHVNKLKADLKSLEEEVQRLQAGAKREEELGRNLRPFPGQGDRQYLTGLKMGGQRILILVGCLRQHAGRNRGGCHPAPQHEQRREAARSQVAAGGGHRRLADRQSPPGQPRPDLRVQRVRRALLEGSQGTWLEARDLDRLNQAVEKLRRLPPEKGTSLINAFEAAAKMSPAPDNLFLLTDAFRPWARTSPGATGSRPTSA